MQLELTRPKVVERLSERAPCPVCRGVPRYCSLGVCPYLRNVLDTGLIEKKLAKDIVFGCSPPGVFVGEYGYPQVGVGPMLALLGRESAEIAEKPNEWLRMEMKDLLALRLGLFHGRSHSSVKVARRPDRFTLSLQEMAQSAKPVDAEVWLEKRPVIRAGFQVRSAPFGPVGHAKRLVVAGNPDVPRRVDAVVSDTDMSANEGVIHLYRGGVSETAIVRLLSSGSLGRVSERKLVPTEWSITAVDDLIGKHLRRRIKRNRILSEYSVAAAEALSNRVTILLLPFPWMFEVAEFWWPKGVERPLLDAELPAEPEKYPENVGGAFHAVRLPILSYLSKNNIQAAAVAILEVGKGWLPLGVWRFRELAREALSKDHTRFDTLQEAIKALTQTLGSTASAWARVSRLLAFVRTQRSLGS